MPVVRSARLKEQKILALAQSLKADESLWAAILVALGALFLLLSFPFYPLLLVPFLAVGVGAIAYKKAPFGTLAGILLAFPAVAYQSPVFAWIYVLIIAITLFEFLTAWSIISFLEIMILAPFAPPPFSLLSGFVVLALAGAALYIGSKKSILIAVPSVLIVLLLSSLWVVENNAFMPLMAWAYGPGMDVLQRLKPEVGILDVIPSGVGSVLSIFSAEHIKYVGPAFGTVWGNLLSLFISDCALLQLVTYAVVLFLIGYIPGRIKGKRVQLISSLPLLLIPLNNYLISTLYPIPFNPFVLPYVLLSIAALGTLEHFNISISRERMLIRKEKAKRFGKFGLQDLGVSSAETLADIGGYEDVKNELTEAIVMPLRKKGIAHAYGIKPPKGVLLFGPPGCGKTMLMRALSKELAFGFYYVKSSDLLSEWYGQSLPYNERIVFLGKDGMRFEKIGEIVEKRKKGKVLSFDESGKIKFADITDFIRHRCTSPILEVRTRTGRKIRVTDYHSLFTLKGSRLASVPTSSLVPKVSYVAIPAKMEVLPNPVDKVNFLEGLRKDDHGLWVKDVQDYVRMAVERLGEEEVRSILGIKSGEYFKFVLKKNIGVRAGKFLLLMKRADIQFDGSGIRVFARKKSLKGEIKIDENIATFLGLWVAEGSYNYDHTVRISTSEREAEKIIGICESLFGRVTVYRKSGKGGKSGKGVDIYICSRVLHVFLRHFLGLESGAGKKKIPDVAFSFSRKNIAAFLRGYFSGDGTIYENQKGIGMVEASTLSDELAGQLLHMLLFFGIVATVYKKKAWSSNIQKRIYLTGHNRLSKFTEIGFLDEWRKRRLEKALEMGRWHREEQIPITGALRESIAQKMPDYACSNTIGKNILLRDGSGLIDDEFMEFLESDIYLDRVEEIKEVKGEEYVYDISVAPCQNFVGGFGGIFAHNSEKNISELFSIARKDSPCILFFDEIDSIGKKRELYTADDVAPRIMSLFLTELDGFATKKDVIVIGATNIPNQLDHALMRPGRFDKIIYMSLPGKKARKAIFKVHTKKIPLSPDVDFARLADITKRYSGADIKNVCTEATRLAASEAAEKGVVVPVMMDHFTTVLESLRPSVSIAKLEEYKQFRLDFERRIGKEKKKRKEEAVKWDDVAGLDEVKSALLEAIEIPLLHEDLIKELKIKPSKGVLLFGPPGCGKTMLVKAAANELNAAFLTVSGASLMKKGYEGSVTIVKETFNRAREQAPCIIFMDEIEAMAPSREVFASSVLSQLLAELDGIKELKNVVLVGATNKPGMLDPAILRPGRFDKIMYIPPPDIESRKKIFTLNLSTVDRKGINLDEIAELTDGFSGADIASICQEAKMRVVRARIRKKKFRITTAVLKGIIKRRKPSTTASQLREFALFMGEYGERK